MIPHPAKDNAHYSFVRQGSALQVRRDLGVLKDENQVLSARDGADQFHAASNKDEKNIYAIRDGKSIATGSPTPVMSRCSRTNKE